MAKRSKGVRRRKRRSSTRRSTKKRRPKGRSRNARKGRTSSKRRSNRRKSRKGHTAASRAGRKLRRGSSEAGQLLGEIGQDIRHEGYEQNPEVLVEEYSGSELLGNPIDYREMARRAHRGGSGKRLKNKLLQL